MTRAHLRSHHDDAVRLGRNAGFPARTAALIHDLVQPTGGACDFRGNKVDRGVQEVALDVVDGRVSVDLAVEFVDVFARTEPHAVDVQSEWRAFRSAISRQGGPESVWASSRDWGREYVRYIEAGLRWRAGAAVTRMVPFDLFRAQEGLPVEAWNSLLVWAQDWGVAVEDLAPYLVWLGREPSLDTWVGEAWRAWWWQALGWQQDFGFARADLLRRAGFGWGEAGRAAGVDEGTLAAMAALRDAHSLAGT